jgi:hypothetical protein
MATSVIPEPLTSDSHEAIARRAREIWQEHGCVDGHAEEDWAQAEEEIRSRVAGPKTATRRIVVKAGSFLYTAEYELARAAYHPGELVPGEPIRLHFEGQKMWLRLPDGRELETRVIRKENT